MRKIFCLFLVAMVLVSVCGCVSNKVDDSVRGEVNNGNQNAPEFSLGKANNNTYNNDFLGISCTLPASWRFYTDKEILELNNMVGEVVDEEIAQQLKNANVIYDMCAISETEGCNMNITLEKLSSLQVKNLDMKQTLEGQIDSIKQVYSNMGYTNISVKYQKVEVDGKNLDGLAITAKIQGSDFYSTVFAINKDNYLASITICSVGMDKCDTILSYFTVE